MTERTNTILNSNQPPFWKTGSLVFIGIAAAMAGLISPINGITFDILLIFSLSLTAMIALIALAAKNTNETGGFALLTVMATTLQVALATSVAKHLLIQQTLGSIVNMTEQLITANRYINMASIYIAVAALLITLETMRKKIIKLRSHRNQLEEYITPIREIGIKGMTESNYISDEHAHRLQQSISKEKLFHYKNTRAAIFIASCALFESIVTASIIFNNITDNTIVSMAIGSACILYLSAFVSVVSCSHLAGKNTPIEIVADQQSHQTQSEPIEVICSDSLKPEEIIDTSFADDEPVIIEQSPAQIKVTPQANAAEQPAEIIDETTDDDSSQPAPYLWTWKIGIAQKAVDMFEQHSKDGNKIFLMAADNIRDLPVTAAIDIAMKTVKKRMRCLLVDFDFVHNLASKVFNAKSPSGCGMISHTCIENLHMFSAGKLSVNNITEFKNTMTNLIDKYDVVLIYAPALKGLATKQKIASCIDSAMLFGSEDSANCDAMSKFGRILRKLDTNIIEPTLNNHSTASANA